MKYVIRAMLLVSCLFVAMGCGGGFTAKGKITKGGQPFTLSDKAGIIMSLTKDGQAYGADVKPTTGTFEVKGPGGAGMKPGTYKVEIQAFEPYGNSSDPTKDLLKGQYAAGKSTLTAEVKSASDEVVVAIP